MIQRLQLLDLRRLFAEPEEPAASVSADALRDPFAIDRDRILYCKAFRRLGYKTQVFVNSEGDNYRTRLTHSLEVAALSRRIAAALGLNLELTETLAFAHDLGHTPFGHAGQEALHARMADHGGFEHNCQSLRIVSVLESWQPAVDGGLNLSRSTLKGIMKRPRIYDCDQHLVALCSERQSESPSPEAELVDLCDRISYLHHDLEDGLDAGLLEFDELSELRLWRESYQLLEKSEAAFSNARRPEQLRRVIRYLMQQSGQRIIDKSCHSGQIELPADLDRDSREILDFLFARLYRHPRVVQMSRRGAQMIEQLFVALCHEPKMLPHHFQLRIESGGVERVVADYIAGMTDRYALDEYRKTVG